MCDVCGTEIAPGRVLACPSCGWPARLTSGDALVLEHLELEVPPCVMLRMWRVRIVPVELHERILADNDRTAAHNRATCASTV